MLTITEIKQDTNLIPRLPDSLNFESETTKKFDFDIEHNMLAPMGVTLRDSDRHILDVNIGRSLNLAWKINNLRRSGVCAHGDVAAIVSPGEHAELSWTPEFNSIRITLSGEFVDRVLQESNVRFQTTCNVNDHELYDLCVKLKEEKWQRENIQSIYAESLATALVIHLACNYPQNGKKVFAPKGKLSSKQLKAIFEYTPAHISKNIRLADMAAIVHMSEFHFARLFKQTLGISPYRFVLQMKIEQAKKLIKDERKSCSDIAYILNFSDQAHFSHVFKKFTGFSPRTFMNAVA
jgi:AraC family transcriptional regulator